MGKIPIMVDVGDLGAGGRWGRPAGKRGREQKGIQALKKRIETQAADVVVGDCQLANGGITDATGRVPVHPMQFVARAYGIEEG